MGEKDSLFTSPILHDEPPVVPAPERLGARKDMRQQHAVLVMELDVDIIIGCVVGVVGKRRRLAGSASAAGEKDLLPAAAVDELFIACDDNDAHCGHRCGNQPSYWTDSHQRGGCWWDVSLQLAVGVSIH